LAVARKLGLIQEFASAEKLSTDSSDFQVVKIAGVSRIGQFNKSLDGNCITGHNPHRVQDYEP